LFHHKKGGVAMPQLNAFHGIGRLGRNPEMEYTPNGTPVTRFSLAIDQNGDGPLWLTIICWRDLAERMSTMLFKGALVFVEGRLVVRKYTGKDKVERTTIV
jgi:single-strand DNA-binding protein